MLANHERLLVSSLSRDVTAVVVDVDAYQDLTYERDLLRAIARGEGEKIQESIVVGGCFQPGLAHLVELLHRIVSAESPQGIVQHPE